MWGKVVGDEGGGVRGEVICGEGKGGGWLTLSSAVPICSLKYCCVRAAELVREELVWN